MWLAVGLMALISFTTLFPAFFVVSSAVKSRREYLFNKYGPPRSISFKNLASAWTGGRMGQSISLSAGIAVCGVILSWIVSSLAAYAVVFLRFAGRRFIFYLILASIMIAPPVILVPLYALVKNMGLINSPVGLILIYVTLMIPFNIYLFSSYFRSLPSSLVEAAELEGADVPQVLWHIILPLARPASVTLAIFNFLFIWNELLFALLLNQGETHTLMVSLANLRGQYTTDIPLLCAGLLISAVPLMLVFLFFQAQLSKGITAGAVK